MRKASKVCEFSPSQSSLSDYRIFVPALLIVGWQSWRGRKEVTELKPSGTCLLLSWSSSEAEAASLPFPLSACAISCAGGINSIFAKLYQQRCCCQTQTLTTVWMCHQPISRVCVRPLFMERRCTDREANRDWYNNPYQWQPIHISICSIYGPLLLIFICLPCPPP